MKGPTSNPLKGREKTASPLIPLLSPKPRKSPTQTLAALMDFARRKAAALAALSSPAPDKSPKGGVDAPIAPLLEVLNSHPDLFTTSSCSGRVSVLAQPQEVQGQGAAKSKKKARGGGWVYVSHDPADPDAVVEQLFGLSGSGAAGDELVFRFEPMIVAVECRDAAAAAALVATAISAGFRESGEL